MSTACIRVLVVISALLFSVTTASHDEEFVEQDQELNEDNIEVYDIADLCSVTLDIRQEYRRELILNLPKSMSSSWTGPDCEVTVVTSFDQYLLFNFFSIQLGTCDDTMTLYRDSVTYYNAVSPNMCSEDNYVGATTSYKGIIVFSTSSSLHNGTAKILVTSFYNEGFFGCGYWDDDYQACDNGRCIHPDLFCNQRNNCGDNSDEPDNCVWLPILLICIGVVAGLSIIACCICCWVCGKGKTIQGHVNTDQTAVTISTGMPNTAPVQSGVMGYVIQPPYPSQGYPKQSYPPQAPGYGEVPTATQMMVHPPQPAQPMSTQFNQHVQPYPQGVLPGTPMTAMGRHPAYPPQGVPTGPMAPIAYVSQGIPTGPVSPIAFASQATPTAPPGPDVYPPQGTPMETADPIVYTPQGSPRGHYETGPTPVPQEAMPYVPTPSVPPPAYDTVATDFTKS